ncbi:hypothetical protein quinque_016493 [Culex quinquefasciatus]
MPNKRRRNCWPSCSGKWGGVSLSDVITGIQVDREGTTKEGGQANPEQRVVRNVKLFDGEPLGIFTDPSLLRESPDVLKTWNALHERELRLAVTHPPANHFQKMALWTEQGKLWRFPINNEQGFDEESKVSFTEHIFLEDHLEPCAQEKREHILWFRDYFEQKKDLLKQVIVQEEASSGIAEAG